MEKHYTVRIPRSLAEAVDDFLKTKQAVDIGFRSKTDVITKALENLLIEYGFTQNIFQEKDMSHRKKVVPSN